MKQNKKGEKYQYFRATQETDDKLNELQKITGLSKNMICNKAIASYYEKIIKINKAIIGGLNE